MACEIGVCVLAVHCSLLATRCSSSFGDDLCVLCICAIRIQNNTTPVSFHLSTLCANARYGACSGIVATQISLMLVSACATCVAVGVACSSNICI